MGIRSRDSNPFNFNVLSASTLHEYLDNMQEISRLGFEVFECVSRLVEKPKPVNFIKEGFKIANIFLTNNVEADEYFYKRWDTPFSIELNDFIVGLLRDFPMRTVKSSDKNRSIRIANVRGEEIGWIHNTTDNSVDGVYCKTDRLIEGCDMIKRIMWEYFGDRSIVLRRVKLLSRSFGTNERVVLDVDDQIPPLQSETAQKTAAYLRKCIAAGVSRSLLFYGPPGTGKSTAVRTIANCLNMRTLRIRVEDLGDMENSVMFDVINTFKPEAIILDDLDRANMMHHMLEMMEFFQRHVKLIMATVNDKDELGEAMLRPGRFDELIEVKFLDDGVIKTVLGEANSHLFDKVKRWPVKFIEELVTRRRFLSEDEAMKSMLELQRRVAELKGLEPDPLVEDKAPVEVPDPIDLSGPPFNGCRDPFDDIPF